MKGVVGARQRGMWCGGPTPPRRPDRRVVFCQGLVLSTHRCPAVPEVNRQRKCKWKVKEIHLSSCISIRGAGFVTMHFLATLLSVQTLRPLGVVESGFSTVRSVRRRQFCLTCSMQNSNTFLGNPSPPVLKSSVLILLPALPSLVMKVFSFG